jgi:hypothetical protein
VWHFCRRATDGIVDANEHASLGNISSSNSYAAAISFSSRDARPFNGGDEGRAGAVALLTKPLQS